MDVEEWGQTEQRKVCCAFWVDSWSFWQFRRRENPSIQQENMLTPRGMITDWDLNPGTFSCIAPVQPTATQCRLVFNQAILYHFTHKTDSVTESQHNHVIPFFFCLCSPGGFRLSIPLVSFPLSCRTR